MITIKVYDVITIIKVINEIIIINVERHKKSNEGFKMNDIPYSFFQKAKEELFYKYMLKIESTLNFFNIKLDEDAFDFFSRLIIEDIFINRNITEIESKIIAYYKKKNINNNNFNLMEVHITSQYLDLLKTYELKIKSNPFSWECPKCNEMNEPDRKVCYLCGFERTWGTSKFKYQPVTYLEYVILKANKSKY